MIVHYRKIWGIILLILALADLGLGLASGLNTNLLIGVILLIIGIGYLTRPYATIEQNTINVLPIFGPLKRTFPFQQLRIENDRLYAENLGISKKVPVTKWMTDENDWNEIVRRTGGVR